MQNHDQDGEPADRTIPSGPSAPTLFDGRYEVESTLGEGGCGRVLLVVDTLHRGAKRALKVILPRFKDEGFEARFRNEIDTMRTLEHVGIPRIFNDGRTQSGETYYTMEYVQGSTLESVLATDAPLRPERVVRMVRQLLAVLDHAHSKGVIHRDLKPANIMVVDAGTPQERVMVLDFGIAKILRKDGLLSEVATLDTMGAIGTPHYMAPEQVLGEDVDETTDLYALGVILYRMLSARLPFAGRTAFEIASARLDAEPAPLRARDAPSNLVDLIATLLRRDRRRRPCTDEVLEALERVAAGHHGVARALRLAAFAVLGLGASLVFVVGGGGERAPEQEGALAVAPGAVFEPLDPAPPSSEPVPDTRSGDHDGVAAMSGQPEHQVPTEVAPHVARVTGEGREIDDPAGPRGVEEGPTGEPAAEAIQEEYAEASIASELEAEQSELEPSPQPEPLEPELEQPGARVPRGFVEARGSQIGRSGWATAVRLPEVEMELVLVEPSDGHYTVGGRRIAMPGAFYIGATEVSWAQFEAVLPESRPRIPARIDATARGPYPVVNVSLEHVTQFCDRLDSRGRLRLPTAAEWIHAASGAQDRDYPWGATWIEGRANVAPDSGNAAAATYAVAASYFDGASPCGALNMCGNVREYCVDEDGVWLAGGSFRNTAASCTTTSLQHAARADRKGHRAVGFRVVLELPPAPQD